VRKPFDLFAGFFFFLVGVVFIVESNKISDSAYGSVVGPDLFPKGLGFVLVILSIRLLYETMRTSMSTQPKRWDQIEESKSGETSHPSDDHPSYDYKRFLLLLGTMALYILTLEKIGYPLSTFLFLLLSIQIMRRGNLLKTTIFSALFSFGIYYVYVYVLKGTLPGWPSFS